LPLQVFSSAHGNFVADLKMMAWRNGYEADEEVGTTGRAAVVLLFLSPAAMRAANLCQVILFTANSMTSMS
jgi:hypothetical protein